MAHSINPSWNELSSGVICKHGAEFLVIRRKNHPEDFVIPVRFFQTGLALRLHVVTAGAEMFNTPARAHLTKWNAMPYEGAGYSCSCSSLGSAL
jgi:hypothetical protein